LEKIIVSTLKSYLGEIKVQKKWWKESVVYQIYPRSFKDSNGDGIGDIKGIIEKLDYLKELGIDVIWLSPVYESPNDDNGYDISDYQAIMDEFGTIEDWETMLSEIHKRDMKLMMDLVVNHTSDEHKWFIESRQSKDNPYRDYYIWRPGKKGEEPSNWQSFFSGSTWQYDQVSDEYYLHLFSKKQPDLNWENPKLRQEIYDMMTWWLEKGIDGFRMDVINVISKDSDFSDVKEKNRNGKHQWAGKYFVNGPRVHEYLQEMKEKVLSRYDIMTVGEMPEVNPEDALKYTDQNDGTLNMVFQFEHMRVDAKNNIKWDVKPFDLKELKQIMTKWQKVLEDKGWNSLYLSNHDQARPVSRFGDDKEYRVESAKMLGTWLHMMQGTPYIYQGEEIGMTNLRFPTIHDHRCIETLNMYKDATENQGKNPEDVMNAIYAKSRDNARTPMQWDDSNQAGFTTGKPWLMVNPNYTEINAEKAISDPNSIYHYYKKLIQLRKTYPIVVYGKYDLMYPDHEKIAAYTRTLENEMLLIVTNFSSEQPIFNLPETISYKSHDLLISNYAVESNENIKSFQMKPYEARVYLLRS
jgi:oligo-1,6-glucosidase